MASRRCYGLHPYAVVNAVTKSGTNQLHGDLFEFVRNGDLNARNFFAPTQDSLHRNQFGGTVSGPIRKDKIFIFGGYQSTRVFAPRRLKRSASCPRRPALSGDFSTLESARLPVQPQSRYSLTDPSTGQPFPNDFFIPVNRCSARPPLTWRN